MRMIFGVLSLLIVVAVIGVLAKKQLGAVSGDQPPAPPGAVAVPSGTPQQQVQQVQKAVEGAIQARPMPDEK